MRWSEQRRQEAELARLARVKQSTNPSAESLGPAMISFFQDSVQRRQTKLGQVAECWSRLVPSTLSDHCALESLNRGTLVVLVDSASHLYELKHLLLAGLQGQLLLACRPAGLRKITLKPGRWYDEAEPATRRVRFGDPS